MKAVGNIAAFVIISLILITITFGFGALLLIVHLVLMFKGAKKRVAAAEDKLKNSVLMQGENLVSVALQLRAHALYNRRKLIAVTDSRVILMSRKLLGGFSMNDYQWKDLRDAKIDEDTFPKLSGSTLSFSFLQSPSIVAKGIPSESAMTIYKYAQREEQAWEEKRRVRGIEEKRAASGGIILGGGVPGGPTTPGAGDISIVDEIRRAKELVDAGAISDAEFEEIKAKILSRQAGHV